MHTPRFYRIYGLPLFVQRFLVMEAICLQPKPDLLLNGSIRVHQGVVTLIAPVEPFATAGSRFLIGEILP